MPCSQEPVGSPQSKREQALWWVPSLPGANDNPLINEQTHRDLSIGATSLFPFCLEVVAVFYFHQKRSKLESLDSLVKHRFLCYVDEESPVCVCMCLSVCVEGIHRETGDPSWADRATEPVHFQMSILAGGGVHPMAGSTCPPYHTLPLHSWQSAATHRTLAFWLWGEGKGRLLHLFTVSSALP